MIRSGVMQRVLDAAPAVEIVLLSPMAADPAFVAEVSQPRVTVRDLPPHRPAGL